MAMSESEIDAALSALTGWSRRDNAITKEYKLQDFRAAIAFLVRVGFEAEQRNHHPEVFNVYNQVTITLSTHDAGGVTDADFDLARAIDSIAA